MENRLYEAMFLVDAAVGDDGLPDVIRHVVELIERFDGRIERIENWGEREPAYPVEGVNNGIYVLVYFRAGSEKVRDIRRVLNISERIARFIILSAEHVPPAAGVIYDTEGGVVEASPAESEDGEEAAGEEAAAPADEVEASDGEGTVMT